MIAFGLTGGICCGKSTVSKTFQAEGIPIIDADVISRQVVEPGTVGLQLLTDQFGSEYLLANGMLDRTKLGNLVFSDKAAMEQLNRIIEPLIHNEITNQCNWHYASGENLVCVDGALLIEKQHEHLYRPLIVVECREVTQLERLMKRSGLTEAEAKLRINSQMSMQQKVAMANYVINTDNSIEESVVQAKRILNDIRSKVLE